MVALARSNAAAEGVSERAMFAQGDLFESDFSKAQVITMFLLPRINMELRPALLNMPPGTRVVSNSFTMEDWEPDQSEKIEECTSWCTAHLWIVPARGGRHLAATPGRTHPRARVSDGFGNARLHAPHGRKAVRRRDHVHGRRTRRTPAASRATRSAAPWPAAVRSLRRSVRARPARRTHRRGISSVRPPRRHKRGP